MKRSIKSKSGFTLIEIIIVVSIIVILSAATFVGVNEVLDRANRNAQDLEEHHGAHFEEEAWATVKNLSVDVEAFKETSETAIDPTEETEETDPTTTESTLAPNDKDQEFLDRRDQLIEMGYLPEEITIIYGDDGHIKSMSWRSTRRGFANGSITGGGGEESQERVMPEKNIQQGVLKSSTPTETTIEAQYGKQVDLNIDSNAIKNANSLTVVYYFEGVDIIDVSNFGSINYTPNISINTNTGLITLTFDLTTMVEWQINNMSQLKPSFQSSGEGETTLTIVEVKTT